MSEQEQGYGLQDLRREGVEGDTNLRHPVFVSQSCQNNNLKEPIKVYIDMKIEIRDENAPRAVS